MYVKVWDLFMFLNNVDVFNVLFENSHTLFTRLVSPTQSIHFVPANWEILYVWAWETLILQAIMIIKYTIVFMFSLFHCSIEYGN